MQDEMLQEFYNIGRLLSSEKDTVKLFEEIISCSLKLTSADAGTMYLVVDKKNGGWSNVKDGNCRGKLLKFIIAKNASINVNLEDFSSPISKKSIFGFTVISGKSLKINDVYDIGPGAEYRHNHSFDNNSGYITRSMLTIPMKNRDNNVTGVLQLINKKRDGNAIIDYRKKDLSNDILPFDNNDELIMNSLAGQAAVALENNLLYRDMQSLLYDYRQQNSQLIFLSRKIMQAHEEERKRIAREIHDGPAQSAVNLSFKLEICKRYLSDGNYDNLTSEINKLRDCIHSTVTEIRTIIYDLKPSCLENGLINALKSLIETFSADTGINMDFAISGDDSKIEYYLTSTIYRIVQEALSNINKHAGAGNVRMELSITDENIILSIADDGKGFNMDELKKRKFDKRKGGFGLEGIKERVELVRGSISIDSSPGKGTGIALTIPKL